jgi:hypothetical protein
MQIEQDGQAEETQRSNGGAKYGHMGAAMLETSDITTILWHLIRIAAFIHLPLAIVLRLFLMIRNETPEKAFRTMVSPVYIHGAFLSSNS